VTTPILSTDRRDDGIAIVSIDVPGEAVNSLSQSHSAELESALAGLSGDPAVRAIVLRSGKPDGFIAGADIRQFGTFRTAADAEAASRAGHAFIDRVESFPKPIVVAVHGACLGLGLELSLGCRYRVASDHPKTQLGLPEIQLGILPGAGGCYRLPRLIGARAALDIILAGKSERAAKAFRLGLVDELVPESILLDVAIAAADRLARAGGPRRPRPGGLTAALLDRTALGRLVVYRAARAQVLKKTKGHYPAPLAALEVVRIGLEKGKQAGLAAEAKAFGELAISAVSRELVQIFFATTALKKDDGVAAGTAQPREIHRLGVVGSGFMGAGIAGTAATTAKVEVRLKDADLTRVGKGIKAALDLVQGQLTRNRITKYEHQRLAALISGSADYRGFAGCDLVIEAVFEDLAVKKQVLAELEAVLPEHAIFASNTSTIPIGRIAENAARPGNVLGMHFFSPVDRMPLLEVIPSARTSPDSIATAVRFGKKLGKTVIVVADSPGFWVNRILAPYFVEAGHLLMEGIPIETIDRTMLDFGFPVGPIALLDEVGIDVAAKAGGVMQEQFGDRLAPAAAIAGMVEAKRLGRKTGSGFYLYHDGHKTDPDPRVYQQLGVKPLATVDRAEVERRLVYPLLNEAARALAEAVVRSPRDGDIGAVFGIGYPPFRGGPLRTIDAIGPASLVAELDRLAQTVGERFAPAESLRELAARDGRYYPDPSTSPLAA
jgi:3-hydroxyacyl-CoA dehydrogenase/enoyl-CoA hydratase/3-hydroxybutyryl-CoA epimerase